MEACRILESTGKVLTVARIAMLIWGTEEATHLAEEELEGLALKGLVQKVGEGWAACSPGDDEWKADWVNAYTCERCTVVDTRCWTQCESCASRERSHAEPSDTPKGGG